MSINLFEFATQQKLRFTTIRGSVDTEALWDMPLQANNGFNLDAVAKLVKKELDLAQEESFVSPTNLVTTHLTNKLEVVKHIIAYRIQKHADASAAASRKAEADEIKRILASKQNAALEQLDETTLKQRLKDLQG